MDTDEFLAKIYLGCLVWLQKNPGQCPDGAKIAADIDRLITEKTGTRDELIDLTYKLYTAVAAKM